jgi:hypothetical protein
MPGKRMRVEMTDRTPVDVQPLTEDVTATP